MITTGSSFVGQSHATRMPIVPTRSDSNVELIQRLANLQNPKSPGSIAVVKQDDLAHQLFDALAQVKILTSQVAMHIDTEWRNKLFRQLDSLHDIEEWEAGDEPIRRESFSTFLRTILSLDPKRRPGLGLSQSGHLVAAWVKNDDRLTIEFLPGDRVRWVLSQRIEGDLPERFAGETRVDLLASRLASHNPDYWFSNAEKERAATR